MTFYSFNIAAFFYYMIVIGIDDYLKEKVSPILWTWYVTRHLIIDGTKNLRYSGLTGHHKNMSHSKVFMTPEYKGYAIHGQCIG